MLKQIHNSVCCRLTIVALTAALMLGLPATLSLAQSDDSADPRDVTATPQIETATPDAETADAAAADAPAAEEPAPTVNERINTVFGKFNGLIAPVLFYDASFGVFEPTIEELEASREAADRRIAELEAEGTTDGTVSRELRIARRQSNVASMNLQSKLDAEKLNKAIARLDAAEAAIEADKTNPAANAELLAAVAEVKALRDAGAVENPKLVQVPLIVIFLAFGGLFFTLRLGFINIRLFTHSLQVITGKYDNPHDHGEINHFQALTSALSATVGLGNIAGVAVAISLGGPGAVFWMWAVAFVGMSSKFCSCTLAQLYRNVTPEGEKSEHVLGGPMLYLTKGVKEQLGGGLFATGFGKVLAISFAIFTICGAIGGGNMFQGNQTFAIVADVMLKQDIPNEDELTQRADAGDEIAAAELQAARTEAQETKLELSRKFAPVGGIILTILVGIVIVGGIKRIGEVTSKLVPAMCVFYCAVCLFLVVANISHVPTVLREIVTAAFTFEAMAWGGVVAVFVQGVKRGAFSNEAGLGSAAIAHSAAKTSEPVREGAVAMIGPFIDTHIVCTMTALAILITDSHLTDTGAFRSGDGIQITSDAFKTLSPWLASLLTVAVFVFAYSTMISWSYYGERACEYLFGPRGIWPFRVVFLLFVFLGPMVSLSNVIDFTDLLILSMAYPNIIGLVILSPVVAKVTADYVRRLKSGEMKPYDAAAEEGEPSI